MDFINPLATSVYQSSQLQELQGAERQRHVRKTQALAKDVAAQDEQLEHQVESSEEVSAIHDEGSGNQQPGQQKNPSQKDGEEEQPHLDLTA